jgi:hypothetical protein
MKRLYLVSGRAKSHGVGLSADNKSGEKAFWKSSLAASSHNFRHEVAINASPVNRLGKHIEHSDSAALYGWTSQDASRPKNTGDNIGTNPNKKILRRP